MNTNYQQYKIQLLNSILEQKLTTALSKKMGFSFDKIKRWQNGSKQLHWNEFCDLCLILKAPLWDALASSLGIIFTKKKDAYQIVSHLKIFSHVSSTRDLAKKMNVSTTTLQRYLNLESYPDLELVLEMIDLRPNFLETFIHAFIGPKKSISKTILSLPWAGAVANAAALKGHALLPQHSSSWIANFLGLTLIQVEEALELMCSIGLIERKGTHYAPTLSRTIGISRSEHLLDYSRFIRYWIARADQRFNTNTGEPINTTNSPNKDAFRIFASSPESATKISEILTIAEQQIHDLLASDSSEKTDVRVLLIHHFSAQDFPKN
jgi:transcriptional regulator with XRE-family HTH domain